MEKLYCSLKIQQFKKRASNTFNELKFGSFTEKNVVRL